MSDLNDIIAVYLVKEAADSGSDYGTVFARMKNSGLLNELRNRASAKIKGMLNTARNARNSLKDVKIYPKTDGSLRGWKASRAI